MRPLLVALALILIACGSGRPPESPNVNTSEESAATPDSSTNAKPSAKNPPASARLAPEEAAADDSAADDDGTFVLHDSDRPRDAHGVEPSKIEPTRTEAAIKFVVVNKDKGPIEGVVISLTSPEGQTYYTQETDAKGYAEVLVPVGKKYDIVYLSLGRKDITASVSVTDEPRQTIRLTLRYKRYDADLGQGHFILSGVVFDTGKATIRKDSYPRLDAVVEYLTHKPQVRIEISGHTDNVGNPKDNKALSERRAQACRIYLIEKGVDGSRIKAVGYGAERPVAPNDSPEGRQQNRRIEATEL
jgi:outer membrane protein OmpA-like peptidoglycan-associated protein